MIPSISQSLAIESEHPVTLAIAGPGSGKTATLIERLMRLIDNGCNPAEFAVITFTNAAAEEIRKRLTARSHLDDCLGFCGTLHAFILRMMASNCVSWCPNKPTVLDEAQAEQLYARVAGDHRYTGTQKEAEAALKAGPFFKPGDNAMPAQRLAREIFRVMAQNNLVTFDAILHYGARLARECGNVTRLRFLFVDEFQDSAPLDYEIYRTLSMPGGKFFVGDPDQAIYGFRGGSVENILDLAMQPGCQTIKMETNYRSDVKICNAAQNLICHNKRRTIKNTESNSSWKGIANVTEWESVTKELAHIAFQVHTPEATAVLLRTREQVKVYSEMLTAMGVAVAKSQARQMPVDWKACKNLVALLNEPDNDFLAGWYLEATLGPFGAKKAILEASVAGKSVNDNFLLIQEIKLLDIPAELVRRGMSRESLQIVSDCIAALPFQASICDLLLAMADLSRSEQDGKGVTVTTMHASKGREWDTVFLPCFEEGVIPKPDSEDENCEAERRLAYVAMTRARHALFISHCAQRVNPWRKVNEAATPSRFIKEAGL